MRWESLLATLETCVRLTLGLFVASRLSPSIDLLLLSHSPSTYTSLYPYARTHWGLKCPVYGTQPTVEVGRLACLEQAEGWRSEVQVVADESNATESQDQPTTGPFVCTPEQINEAFDHVKAVRYSQPIHLSGLLSHLLLTPYPSGQTLGGSLFKLRSPTSGTILYALGLNHTTERHLSGTVLLSTQGIQEGGLGRPDLLVMEAGRSLTRGVKMKDRVSVLLNLVTETMRGGNSLLFPVDNSPRLLELLVLLDQHWSYQISQSGAGPQQQQQRPGNWSYPLCLVSKTGEEGVRVARSLMEWMGGTVAKEEGLGSAQGTRGGASGGQKRKRANSMALEGATTTGALRFKHLRFFSSVQEYEQAVRSTPLGASPRCVLAAPMNMSYGPSRRLFTSMAKEPGTRIVLTGRSERGTLGQDLFETWNGQQDEDAKRYGMGKVGDPRRFETTSADSEASGIKVVLNSKVPLEGDELEAFLEQERLQKEKQAAAQAAKERSRRLLEADDLDSDSDDEDDDGSDHEADGAPEALELTGAMGTDGPGRSGAGANGFMDPNDDARNTSFDIYVKGQQVRSGGFFKSGGGSATQQGGLARFRMFPLVERRGRKIDTYGETIDIGAWVRKGREIEQDQESDQVKEAKRKQKELEEKAKEPPEPPSKFVVEQVDVNVECQVMFVDMEGQHDGRAVKTIVPQLHPRKLVSRVTMV